MDGIEQLPIELTKEEAAELSKNQILQQAGTAMLAQANSQAETVLSLLK